MTQHTPAPWNIIEGKIIGGNGDEVKFRHIPFLTTNYRDDVADANREYLFKCVNQHQEMLNALWSVLPKLLNGSPEWQIVHDAINKAEGK